MTEATTAKASDRTILIIEKSRRNKRLTKPVSVSVKQTKDKVALDIQNYIIQSLSTMMPSLIPFALRNRSLFQLAKYLKYDKSGSAHSLTMYAYAVSRFCQWREMEPDDLIAECKDPDDIPNSHGIAKATKWLNQYYEQLKAQGLAPKTVGVWVAMIKSFYQVNGVKLTLTRKLGGREVAKDRAPTPGELQHLIDTADLRNKVIVSMLALGGFREGTLSKLRYRHVKRDYENGITPIHIHVEAEITKGKYHDYDTFLGKEAEQYLRAYLEERKRGTPSGKIPPEAIHDESPIIRSKTSKTPKPITPGQIYDQVHSLYYKAGLLGVKRHKRYEVRPHSIRKFFRTQLAALGVDKDYIEYMMGHKVGTYHDIQMKGIEFLRGVYAASGLSIRPKTQLSKIDALKEIIRAWGMNPEEVLTREALSKPHRTYIQPHTREEEHVKTLSIALKKMMRKELLNSKRHSETL